MRLAMLESPCSRVSPSRASPRPTLKPTFLRSMRVMLSRAFVRASSVGRLTRLSRSSLVRTTRGPSWRMFIWVARRGSLSGSTNSNRKRGLMAAYFSKSALKSACASSSARTKAVAITSWPRDRSVACVSVDSWWIWLEVKSQLIGRFTAT